MVEGIAGHLPLSAFRDLRLVCSSLNQQLQHQFRERFFRQHTLAWSTESFHALTSIVTHEYYGTALKVLVIDATPSYAVNLWKINRQGVESPNSELEFQLQRKEDILTEEAKESAKFWTESRFDQTNLIAIFQRVKNLDSIVFAYDGMEKHWGKFARIYCERSRNEMSRPFVVAMAAIAESGIVVRTISIHRDRKYGAVSIGRLESLSPRLAKFDVAFQTLHNLQLNLRDWRHPEEGFELPEARAPFIVRFLAKCTNIRRFEISCFSSLEEDIFPEMSRHCKFPHMEHCQLELFRLSSADDIFNFLEAAKCSLRSLSLSHIVLRDETATWPDLMRRIASDLDLETIDLKNLFSRFGARVGIEGTLKGTISLSGPSLKQRLEYHAEHLIAGNWGPAWHLASSAYPFIGLRT